uniref:TEF transcription factor, PAR bZIP family member b n=1 Tax=Fundulus heteroclitus TaxID=8078 RepID=A0A3Q2PXZ6_FUNHE
MDLALATNSAAVSPELWRGTMPGNAAVTVALPAAAAAPQKSYPFVLKKIMDIPPPNILEEGDDGKPGKSFSDGGGATGGGVSASLTPAIWEKTIPYDGETFHLEYMDLDEFLLENGIPVSKPVPKVVALAPAAPVAAPLAAAATEVSAPAPPAPSPSEATSDVEETRNTPSPIDPDAIEVDINFQPDPTDLVLSSVPGGELFNPRKHKFSDEELKPQPMIKKAKKVFVPDEQKDEKYWSRRKKNNVAAKRSRDARRLKENQITVRASFLERENAALRQQVAELRKDCGRCKNVLARYEAKYGPL